MIHTLAQGTFTNHNEINEGELINTVFNTLFINLEKFFIFWRIWTFNLGMHLIAPMSYHLIADILCKSFALFPFPLSLLLHNENFFLRLEWIWKLMFSEAHHFMREIEVDNKVSWVEILWRGSGLRCGLGWLDPSLWVSPEQWKWLSLFSLDLNWRKIHIRQCLNQSVSRSFSP